MTRYLDNVVRLLVLILRKMSGYLRTFKHKDKNKGNKMSGYAKTFKDNELMPFHVDHC